MFDLLDNLVPMLIFFMLVRGILDVLLSKKRRRVPNDDNTNFPEAEPDMQQEQQETVEAETASSNKPDVAADFERRLRKRKKSLPPAEENDAVLVNYETKQPERRDKQRIHYDGEPQHEGKGRIHRDNESFVHDKNKLYRDPKSGYGYDEAKFNEEVAACSVKFAKNQEQPKIKLKLKHSALVNGFIMSQVLDKPRSIKPYSSEEIG